ncbi:MAG TPA: glycosyltransferase [Longimicrobiales bacterium]
MSSGVEQTPSLSVVVVILAGPQYLVRCLTALQAQRGAKLLEVIVPHDDRVGDMAVLRRQFPAVQFVHQPGRHSYAELRSLGFRTARGDIIALTEDHCSPEPEWCATILNLHRGPYAAVGGSVDKSGHDSALNWAIYLSDFGRYMNPVHQGPAGYLTDCNVSYKRSAIEPIAELWADAFHETTVNWALQDRGEKLLLSPTVVVQQQRTLTWDYALRERFNFGRLFASTRVAAVGPAKRAVYAAASGALPFIIVGRVVRNVAEKRRAVSQFFMSLPHIIVLALTWSLGEFVGYLTGRASPTGDAAWDTANETTSEVAASAV